MRRSVTIRKRERRLEEQTMKKLHVTIQNGGPIQLEKCTECCTKFHCPFCRPDVFMPTVESKVRKHIKAHENRAVKFKGYVIFKCGLDCRTISHFHCPKCCKLVDKKNRFVDHLSKCVTGEGGEHQLHVQQDSDHDPEEKKYKPLFNTKVQDCSLEVGPSRALPSQSKMSIVEENTPTALSACSAADEMSWHEAFKGRPTYQENNNFKSSEVLVNTQCLLELFQFCWFCHKECCITIEGNQKLFSVMQDCQSCGFHRDWKSHPSLAEPTQTLHNEEEHNLEDEDGKEVVVQIVSSDDECSEGVFIEKDGSYLSINKEEGTLEEQEVRSKRKRTSESKEGSQEWEPYLEEEAVDSDVSMD